MMTSERTGRRFALVRTTALGDQPEAGQEIAEVLEEVRDISREFTPLLLASCVEVTSHDPMPEPGWVLGTDGSFAPREFKPTPFHEMCEAFARGVEVKVGKKVHRVPADGPAWAALEEEAHHARLYGKLAGGDESTRCPTLGGSLELDASALITVHNAVLGWRIAWRRYAGGRAPSPPKDGPITAGD